MNFKTKFLFLEKNDSKRLIRLNIYNCHKPTFIIEYKLYEYNMGYILIRNPYLQAVMANTRDSK
jgi:hypothetical protein